MEILRQRILKTWVHGEYLFPFAKFSASLTRQVQSTRRFCFIGGPKFPEIETELFTQMECNQALECFH